MARIIKLTDQYIETLRDEIMAALRTARMADGKFNFQKSFDKMDVRATLKFTERAWFKMQALIMKFDKEVAWHGVVVRGAEENEYVVTDILVYPQTITSTTVVSDDEKYPLWYAMLTDTPEVFNNLRMQGHSHVNMGVTPSGTDLAFYKELLDQVGDDSFYVFVIFNKKGDKTVKIYDFEKNMLFETADVDVSILDEDGSLDQFLKDAGEMVRNEPVRQTYSSQKSAGGYQYSGYSGYSGAGYYNEYSGEYITSGKPDKKEKESKQSAGKKYKAGFKSIYDYDEF